MRKDAKRAIAAIKDLGFTEEYWDSREHLRLRHPARDVEVKLSLSPSDIHGPSRSIREAHLALGLPAPRAAGKRRSADVRQTEESARRARDRAERVAREQKAHIDRWRNESWATLDQRLRELGAQISSEMVILRRCRTPAGRAVVEARIRPLAIERQRLINMFDPLTERDVAALMAAPGSSRRSGNLHARKIV